MPASILASGAERQLLGPRMLRCVERGELMSQGMSDFPLPATRSRIVSWKCGHRGEVFVVACERRVDHVQRCLRCGYPGGQFGSLSLQQRGQLFWFGGRDHLSDGVEPEPCLLCTQDHCHPVEIIGTVAPPVRHDPARREQPDRLPVPQDVRRKVEPPYDLANADGFRIFAA